MFRFGVDSFIWSENFSEKDLWIIPKAKELGFETLDIAVAHPHVFPTDKVEEKVPEVGIEVVTTTTLNKNTNEALPQTDESCYACAEILHNPASPTHASAHFHAVHEPRPARYSASRHRDRARQGNHRSWDPASPPVPGFGRAQATFARGRESVPHFQNLTKKVKLQTSRFLEAIWLC